MASIQLNLSLPDDLARELRQAGLLESAALESLLRHELSRQQRRRELGRHLERVAADPTPPMTPQEIEAEVAAVRRARRANHADRG